MVIDAGPVGVKNKGELKGVERTTLHGIKPHKI